jgi:hypothetical protein
MKNVQFTTNIDKVLEENFFDGNLDNLLILDDVMDEISNNLRASQLFTKYIHHKNMSVLFLLKKFIPSR